MIDRECERKGHCVFKGDAEHWVNDDDYTYEHPEVTTDEGYDIETIQKANFIKDCDVEPIKKSKERECPKQRMYCLVVPQLSQIQKGIQSAHAIVEYSNKFYNNDDYFNWSEYDKTIIVLDAKSYSDIIEIMDTTDHFYRNEINYAAFREESLNNMITAICFLVPENIYNERMNNNLFKCNFNNKDYYLLDIIKNRKLSL